MQFRLVSIALFAALVLPAAAHAQAVSDEAKELEGTWEISNADRDKICNVTLALDKAPHGLKLSFDPGCTEAFEVTKDITAWRLDKEGLHFIDSKGEALIDLDEVEKGIFEGMRPGEGRYFVQSLAAVRTDVKPEQIFGEWQVSRGTDESICVIAFLTTKVGDNYSLSLKPGCAAVVTGFGPVSWNIDRDELVISSPKGTWRFEEAGEIAWRRVPEGNDPLWLVRQVDALPPPEGGG